MIILTLAVAISAWIIFNTRNREAPPTYVDQAKQLRQFIAYNFSVPQEVNVQFSDRGFRFPDLVEAAQLQLDFRLKQDNVPYKYVLVDRLPKTISRPPTDLEEMLQREVILTDEAVTPKPFGEETDVLSTSVDKTQDSVTTETGTNVTSSIVDLDADDLEDASSVTNSSGVSSKSVVPRMPEYAVELDFNGSPKLSMDLIKLKVYMSYHLDFIHQNDLPFYITQAVYDMLLKPDIDMWKDIHGSRRKFRDVTRRLKVNFVAAEESGETHPEIADAISQHMRKFDDIKAYVDVQQSVHVLNVSKQRAAAHFLQNTTDELTFFYSTTLRPYANTIQGVPLRHLDLLAKETNIEGDPQGTEYQERFRQSQIDTYDVTSFLEEATDFIKGAVRFSVPGSSNLVLMAETTMKHYTIIGLTEVLDALLETDISFDVEIYKEVCKVVDKILQEGNHDWAEHLSVVAALHEKVVR
ncbi:hypothetical protein JCM33374_g1240 [Metschnikowia sp. JCM 33374]|nr:hypothetical protein JCM33374_g1240 [Metschnikowia sp. JCM 33374]